ncbi:MAG: hypothetical protein H6581_17715 [Bacteroidia bacterium]|nr:hypothetical protein [Bacteroidia bacterium]
MNCYPIAKIFFTLVFALILLNGCGNSDKGLTTEDIAGTWVVTNKVFIDHGRSIEDKKCGDDNIYFMPDMAFQRDACAGHSTGKWSLPKVGEQQYVLMDYTTNKDADYGDSCKVVSREGNKMVLIAHIVAPPKFDYEVKMVMEKKVEE